jgi:hypothetical protein
VFRSSLSDRSYPCRCRDTAPTATLKWPTVGSVHIFPVYYLLIRPALGPTQPPVQWVPGVPSPGIKAQPGRDADH